MRVANISEEQTRSMYMSPPPNPSNSYSQVHEECHTNVIINHITLQNLKIQKDRNRLLCEILPLTPFVRMNGWLSSEVAGCLLRISDFLLSFSFNFLSVVLFYGYHGFIQGSFIICFVDLGFVNI